MLVPSDMNWHSAPNSTDVLQCVNYRACKRPDDKIQMLQACQVSEYNIEGMLTIDLPTAHCAHFFPPPLSRLLGTSSSTSVRP